MSHSSISVARYLLDRAHRGGRGLSPMKVIKLVYIAHGWMLGLYGRPLICENVEAWRYGPVIRELYHEVKRFRSGSIPPEKVVPPVDREEFDKREKSVMDQTLDIYGRHGAIRLSQMTHEGLAIFQLAWASLNTAVPLPGAARASRPRDAAGLPLLP